MTHLNVENLLAACRQDSPNLRYSVDSRYFNADSPNCRQAYYSRPTFNKPIFHITTPQENISGAGVKCFSHVGSRHFRPTHYYY